MTDLELSTNGERIVWRGKPQFKCFILETIFNPLLIVAIFWACFDYFVMRMAFLDGAFAEGAVAGFLIPFFLLHLMPVWLYLGGVITSVIRHKNTEYIITDRAVYVSGGVFTVNVQMKPFAEISNINIHKGIFDQMLGVGDVIMTCAHVAGYEYGRRHNHNNIGIKIIDIEEYQEVFKILKNMQTDVYADTMYPNALRPEENPGYNTKYDRF